MHAKRGTECHKSKDGTGRSSLNKAEGKPWSSAPGPSIAVQSKWANDEPGVPRCVTLLPGLVGDSKAIRELARLVRLVAPHSARVLIEGETGSGKELVARAVHTLSNRRSKPFVALNCAAIPETLLEAELFGHTRGAFTGAVQSRLGRIEAANGGTLFLDEIGELPLDLQPYLLRALEEGVIYRLGDGQPRRVQVRLLALTNRNLLDEVAAGRFRRDLYHRISVTRICPPPLRDREGDVGILVAHFNAQLAERHGVPARHFGPEVMQMLAAYHWPGNVRELRNVVESLLLMSNAPEVHPGEIAASLAAVPAVPGQPGAPVPDTPATLEASERAAVVQTVRLHHGNLTAAARALGVSRSTLYRKLGRYGPQV